MARARRALLIVAISLVGLTIYRLQWSKSERLAAARQCFTHDHLRLDNIRLLDDIMDTEPKPIPGQSVFFHETSCTDGVVKLSARQACAIESAALTNPAWDVYLLFASPSGFHNHTQKPDIVRALEHYPNIKLRNANLWNYARGTPIEKWMDAEYLFDSLYINSHTSDFLRYLSLYKWGGTYLDLDVIVKHNLSTIQPNYAGAESARYVAAGVINLEPNGQGHQIAGQCLEEFERNFDGSNWGHNGPGVITRVLQKVCHTTYPPLMTRSRCNTFEVFPIESFYAVPYEDWRHFFDETKTEQTLISTHDSIVVHMWNKFSIAERVRVGSNVAYGLLAAKYCPLVYAASGEYF